MNSTIRLLITYLILFIISLYNSVSSGADACNTFMPYDEIHFDDYASTGLSIKALKELEAKLNTCSSVCKSLGSDLHFGLVDGECACRFDLGSDCVIRWKIIKVSTYILGGVDK